VAPDRVIHERIALNDARFRSANESIAKAVEKHDVDDNPIRFLCECADV
jgi:hypothetical protein